MNGFHGTRRRGSRSLQRDLISAWLENKPTPHKASNMFVEGRTIYSYGHHFPLATLFDGFVAVTNRHYSVTTSCHLSLVCSALAFSSRHTLPQLEVYDPTCSDHARNLAELRRRLENVAQQILGARGRLPYYVEELQRLQKQVRLYCRLWWLPQPRRLLDPAVRRQVNVRIATYQLLAA